MAASHRHQQKRHGKHQKHTPHFLKVYTPYLPLLLIVTLGLVLSAVSPPKLHKGVLAYATSMSSSQLLAATNQERVTRGLPALKLNAALGNAAQNKANDMVAKNYWAHDPPGCPSAGTCWYKFVVSAGYKYKALGENLASGFATSDDTVQGWMDSSEHRANMLNSTYVEVGFGYQNSANFVGTGQETVVVAEYAKPASSPKTVAASTKAASTTYSGSVTAQSTSKPASPTASMTTTATTTAKTAAAPIEPATHQITRVSKLTGLNISWLATAATLITISGLSILLARHTYALHKWLRRGERYILKHFSFDLTVLGLIGLCYIATQSIGFIK